MPKFTHKERAMFLGLSVTMISFYSFYKIDLAQITAIETKIRYSQFTRTLTSTSDFCDCKIDINDNIRNELSDPVKQSRCSDKASEFGTGQNVVSYSLFVDKGGNITGARRWQSYYDGVRNNLDAIRKYYKGWNMRLYTVPEANLNNVLCELECNNSDFFLCNAEKIPQLGDVSINLYGMMWRFLPFGDPTVNAFLSRDLDSVPSLREKDSVFEWLNSNYTFHAMRDHYYHYTHILGGMWGAKNNCTNSSYYENLFSNSMFEFNKNKSEFKNGFDQKFLTDIYPHIKTELLVHDSYFCTVLNDSVPFPTKRQEDGQFVGSLTNIGPLDSEKIPCPIACRPSYGKNWTYC